MMLFFREATIDESQMMRQQMGGGGMPVPGQDTQKLFEGERAALDLVGFWFLSWFFPWFGLVCGAYFRVVSLGCQKGPFLGDFPRVSWVEI